jgi:hypothetical protein
MPMKLPYIIGAVCLAAIASGAAGPPAGPGKEVTHRFKMTTAANVDVEYQGEKHKLTADTELRYQWTCNARERSLTFESILAKARTNDDELTEIYMSREKLATTKEGKATVVPIATAPEELKKKLEDSFGVPLCKLEVDGNGKEVKRKVVAGDGAKALLDKGMIANALLFHPPFRRDVDEWQADTMFSVGDGSYASGKLTYKKTDGGKAGQLVKVSGTLTSKDVKTPGLPGGTTQGKFVVRGEQTFDPLHQEWVSGKLTIDVSMEMTVGGQAVGSAAGTMVVTFEKIAGNP